MAASGVLLAVVLWGGSFAVTKLVLDEVSVATLLFGRSVLGTLVVGGWLASRGRIAALERRDVAPMIALSLLGNVLPQLLQAHALLRSSSASTAWLVAMIPVVTALLAWWLLGERLRGKAAGIIVAFAGTLLVVSGGASPGEMARLPSTRGDLLTLASTVSWSLYTIYGRTFVGRYPAAVAMSHLLATSVCVFAPFFVIAGGWRELAALSAGGWLSLLYLGVGCSGLAFTLWYAALERMEASRVAAFIYLEPLVAQMLAQGMLREPLRATTLLGGLAILAGVYRVSRSAAVVVPAERPVAT
ncbi:MAG: DMT family transporter [Candidatus Binatia bacterium]